MQHKDNAETPGHSGVRTWGGSPAPDDREADRAGPVVWWQAIRKEVLNTDFTGLERS